MMDRSQLTDRKRHLPEIALDSETGDAALLRPGRSLLVLQVHDLACAECRRYLDSVAQSAGELASWGGDIALVVAAQPGAVQPRAAPDQLPSSFRIFHDPKARFEAALGNSCPGVVIVDQWGDVVLTHSAGPTHDFPPVPDLVSEIRYLGTRCPECEGESL